MTLTRQRSVGIVCACLAACAATAIFFSIVPVGGRTQIPGLGLASPQPESTETQAANPVEVKDGVTVRVRANTTSAESRVSLVSAPQMVAVVVEDYLHQPLGGMQVMLTDNQLDPEPLSVATSQSSDGCVTFEGIQPEDISENGARAYLNVLASEHVDALIPKDSSTRPVLTAPAMGSVTVRLSRELVAKGGHVNLGTTESPVVLAKPIDGKFAVTFDHVGIGLQVIARLIRPSPAGPCEVRAAGPVIPGGHVVVEVREAHSVEAVPRPKPVSSLSVRVAKPNGAAAPGIHLRARARSGRVSDAACTDADGVAVLSRFDHDEQVVLSVLTPEWRATPPLKIEIRVQSVAIDLVAGGVIEGRAEPRKIAARPGLEWLLLRSSGNHALPMTVMGSWIRQTPASDGTFRFVGLRPGTYALQLVADGDRQSRIATKWLHVEDVDSVVSMPPIWLGQAFRPIAFSLVDEVGGVPKGAQTFLIDRHDSATGPSACSGAFDQLVAFERSHLIVTCPGYQSQTHLIDNLPPQIRLRPSLRFQLDLGDLPLSAASITAEPAERFDAIGFGDVRSSMAGRVLIAELPGPGTYRAHVGGRSAVFVVKNNNERGNAKLARGKLEVLR
jgi:hypothetical protein